MLRPPPDDTRGVLHQPPDAASSPLGDIAERVVEGDGDTRSSRRIAGVIGRMISSGELAVGTRLPTVRELASCLGVSPTTVSEAWHSLASVGAIEARGRNGTYVRPPVGPGGPRRYRRITEGPGHFSLDLSTGTPDPALLPDLGPVVSRVGKQSLTSSYLDHPVLPALEDELVATWPFPPEAMTVVDGAMDGLDRVAAVVLRLGDRVVVEHPGFPPMLDLLDQLGCDVVGVDVDDDGPVVADLRAAVAVGEVRAVILQPRAQNPAGSRLTATRARALAELLATTDAIIVEDDHANDISAARLISLGSWLPARTVHIRSYSKSHGPDLRLAAVGGAGEVVTAIANRRLLGPGWSSRILQALLLELLQDPATPAVMERARETYARRRSLVCDVLAGGDVGTTGTDGINLWVRVADERSAAVALAARGIGVAPGDPFLIRPDHDHLRVTVGLLTGSDDRVREIATHLAHAAVRPPARQTHHR